MKNGKIFTKFQVQTFSFSSKDLTHIQVNILKILSVFDLKFSTGIHPEFI